MMFRIPPPIAKSQKIPKAQKNANGGFRVSAGMKSSGRNQRNEEHIMAPKQEPST